MFARFVVLCILVLTSSKTFALLICADDFAIGQEISQLTGNASLSWHEGGSSSPLSTVWVPQGYYHNHFGGNSSAATTGINLNQPDTSFETPSSLYSALGIQFQAPVRSFGFRAENITGNAIALLLYDTQGKFLKSLYETPLQSAITFNDGFVDIPTWQFCHTYDFDVDVGAIKIGGISGDTYIYALEAHLPEPSSLLLLLTGVLGMQMARRRLVNPA